MNEKEAWEVYNFIGYWKAGNYGEISLQTALDSYFNKQSENRPIIIGTVELCEQIVEYAKMFPDTYTTYDSIENTLQRICDEGRVGGVFGIQVSPEWEDRCYGFEPYTQGEQVFFKFLGMMKS